MHLFFVQDRDPKAPPPSLLIAGLRRQQLWFTHLVFVDNRHLAYSPRNILQNGISNGKYLFASVATSDIMSQILL